MAILGYSLTPKTTFVNFSFFKKLFFFKCHHRRRRKILGPKKVQILVIILKTTNVASLRGGYRGAIFVKPSSKSNFLVFIWCDCAQYIFLSKISVSSLLPPFFGHFWLIFSNFMLKSKSSYSFKFSHQKLTLKHFWNLIKKVFEIFFQKFWFFFICRRRCRRSFYDPQPGRKVL